LSLSFPLIVQIYITFLDLQVKKQKNYKISATTSFRQRKWSRILKRLVALFSETELYTSPLGRMLKLLLQLRASSPRGIFGLQK
jgi:hypothetical protein